MPLRRTEDVVHVALTDHRIQRSRPARDLLASLSEKHESYRGPVVPYYPQRDPDEDRDLYLAIAQVKDKANLQQGAEMLSKALVRSKSQSAEPWFELAEAQAALGKIDSARQSYERALELDPGHGQAENNLAHLLSAAGKLRDAVLHYSRSLMLEPLSSVTHTNLGLTLLEMGDRKGAAEAFAAAIRANPLDAAGHVNAGSLFLLEGQLDLAWPALEKAVAINPSSTKARNNLGLLLLALGEHNDAAFHLGYVLRHGTPAERQTTREVLRKAGVSLP
jgi:Tfp pilus assembly protein PilF